MEKYKVFLEPIKEFSVIGKYAVSGDLVFNNVGAGADIPRGEFHAIFVRDERNVTLATTNRYTFESSNGIVKLIPLSFVHHFIQRWNDEKPITEVYIAGHTSGGIVSKWSVDEEEEELLPIELVMKHIQEKPTTTECIVVDNFSKFEQFVSPLGNLNSVDIRILLKVYMGDNTSSLTDAQIEPLVKKGLVERLESKSIIYTTKASKLIDAILAVAKLI